VSAGWRRGWQCLSLKVRPGTTVRPDELERRSHERLDALGPAPRAELLHVLMLPDFDRADRIGPYWATQASAWSEAGPGGCGYRGAPFRMK
jgi:hypothetical protein